MTIHTLESLMALATQYHEATINWVASGEPTAKARAALSTAITEVLAERDTLQSKCDEQAREIEAGNVGLHHYRKNNVELRAQLKQQVDLVEKCMVAMNENADRGQAAEAKLREAVHYLKNAEFHAASDKWFQETRDFLTPDAAPKTNTYPGTYWMIECSHGFTGWWKGSGKVDCRLFDKDPTKGKRFATKQEAEAAIQHSCQIATEHMDCAPGAAPQKVERRMTSKSWVPIVPIIIWVLAP